MDWRCKVSLIVNNLTIIGDSGGTRGHGDRRDSPPVIHGVSFEIHPGTLTLVVGPTGAGKSTLLSALAGSHKPVAGVITYDNVSLWQKNRLDPRVIGSLDVMFQHPEELLFARTVQGEFDYALGARSLTRNERFQRAKAGLQSVGLSERMLHQSPFTLSGGERRRLALACSAAMDARWRILDEPTVHLDPAGVEIVVDLVTKWRDDGAGVILATHDLDVFLPIADRIIVLVSGQVQMVGTPTDWYEQPAMVWGLAAVPSYFQLRETLGRNGYDLPSNPLTPLNIARTIDAELRHKKSQACAAGEGDVDLCPEDDVGGITSNPRRPSAALAHCANPSNSLGDGGLGSGDRAHAAGDQRIACNGRYGEVADAREIQTEHEALLPTPTSPLPSACSRVAHQLARFLATADPRAKWIFYTVLSIGVLQQHHFGGLVVASVLVATSLFITHTPRRTIVPILRIWAVWMIGSGAIAAIQVGSATAPTLFDSVHVSSTMFFRSIMVLTPFLLMTLLGAAVTSSTTGFEIKRAIEAVFEPIKWLRVPVEVLSLSAAMILRFLPRIYEEYHRFSLVTRVRGRSSSKVGRIRVRDLVPLMVPFLLSLLRYADGLATAMELRGYGRLGQQRTSCVRLSWRGTDSALCVIGAIITLLLFLASTWT